VIKRLETVAAFGVAAGQTGVKGLRGLSGRHLLQFAVSVLLPGQPFSKNEGSRGSRKNVCLCTEEGEWRGAECNKAWWW